MHPSTSMIFPSFKKPPLATQNIGNKREEHYVDLKVCHSIDGESECELWGVVELISWNSDESWRGNMVRDKKFVQYSIIIPAYNEVKRASRSLPKIVRWLALQGEPCEIILVDDGSVDGTFETATQVFHEAAKETPGAREIRWRPVRLPKNRGKGHAVREGMLHARGHYCLFTDIDLSTPIEEAARFFALLRAGEVDVVAGSRHAEGSQVQRQGWLRQVMGWVFRKLVMAFTGLNIVDTQCGFKAFTYWGQRQIFTRLCTDGFAFDVEVLFLAKKLNLRTREVGVIWVNDKDTRVRLISSSISMIRDTTAIKKRFSKAA